MIAAISLIRRRPDISIANFRKHWLDPHGVMTAGLPGVCRYTQSHCVGSPATNALAESLGIDGFPVLWFRSYEERRIAYTSPRMAQCNVDSEQFIGAVTRLVTEPVLVRTPPPETGALKLLLLATGAPDAAWADLNEARFGGMTGVTGYIRHNLIEQAAAPRSRIPELRVAVAGIAEVTFDSEATLAAGARDLAGDGRTAVFVVEDVRFV